jgi:hypothetical protein
MEGVKAVDDLERRVLKGGLVGGRILPATPSATASGDDLR